MFIIALYHLIFGFIVAVGNNYIFLSVDDIVDKYQERNVQLYFEMVGWILLEVSVVLAEIYIIRNIIKWIMTNFHTHNPNRKLSENKQEKLKDLVKMEQSANIMIGYTVYLFNYKLNYKFAFLMESITNQEHEV